MKKKKKRHPKKRKRRRTLDPSVAACPKTDRADPLGTSTFRPVAQESIILLKAFRKYVRQENCFAA